MESNPLPANSCERSTSARVSRGGRDDGKRSEKQPMDSPHRRFFAEHGYQRTSLALLFHRHRIQSRQLNQNTEMKRHRCGTKLINTKTTKLATHATRASTHMALLWRISIRPGSGEQNTPQNYHTGELSHFDCRGIQDRPQKLMLQAQSMTRISKMSLG